MSATIRTLTREFLYNGMKIPDPNPNLTPEKAVEALAAGGYPELVNAKIEPATSEGGVQTFPLKVATGTKG